MASGVQPSRPDAKLTASVARATKLRRRSDLICHSHRYCHETIWVVKDPLSLKYFKLPEPEYFILQRLDGESTPESIKEAFDREYAPQTLRFSDLEYFLGHLHQSGLVLSNGEGQGSTLIRRGRKSWWKKKLSVVTNPLAIRWRGADPDQLLGWLEPCCRWVFSKLAVLTVAILAVSALLLVMVQWKTFSTKLPEFQQFFGPANWLLLGLTVGCAKILHELGHGLSCKKYGGECHEIGFMLLVFTPALYCNVSDSWLLRSKWQRMAVGAAGIYVELAIAALATFGWWFSQPGLFNHLCLNLMFVCSVSTVVFNGNPLMRFDGYFILADYVEIPNLRQRSSMALRDTLVWLALGVRLNERVSASSRVQTQLVVFALLSWLYRWTVVFSILLGLYVLLAPYGLGVIGKLLGLVGVIALVAQPLWQSFQILKNPVIRAKMKRRRLYFVIGILLGLLLVVTALPLPYRVYCPVTIQLTDGETVFAQGKGIVERLEVRPGQAINQGDLIARCTDIETELTRHKIEGQLASVESDLAVLRRQRHHDRGLSSEIQVLRQSKARLESELEKLEAIRERLTVFAPRPGVVYPVAVPTSPTSTEDLPVLQGSLFESQNQGVPVDTGTPICRIGDPDRLEAVLWVAEDKVEFLQVGQRVKLQIDASASRTVLCRVTSIAEKEVDSVPFQLTQQVSGDIPAELDSAATWRPLKSVYQVKCQFSKDEHVAIPESTGHAKVMVGSRTIAQRVMRFLRQTFHFQLEA